MQIRPKQPIAALFGVNKKVNYVLHASDPIEETVGILIQKV